MIESSTLKKSDKYESCPSSKKSLFSVTKKIRNKLRELMARTKQTARKSTGGMAPRKQLTDHAQSTYNEGKEWDYHASMYLIMKLPKIDFNLDDRVFDKKLVTISGRRASSCMSHISKVVLLNSKTASRDGEKITKEDMKSIDEALKFLRKRNAFKLGVNVKI